MSIEEPSVDCTSAVFDGGVRVAAVDCDGVVSVAAVDCELVIRVPVSTGGKLVTGVGLVLTRQFPTSGELQLHGEATEQSRQVATRLHETLA
jgi:hypothetical protein